MEGKTSACSISTPREASNYDELFMRHTMLFADNLKDLKNIRKQLYSAAEYFELSYCKDDHQQQSVMKTSKDYISKAIVGTVDHLGSVAHKINKFLDEKVGEVSGAELQLSCIEQRLQTCQKYTDCGGASQQSLLIQTRKYQKQYTMPETMIGIGKMRSICNDFSPCVEHDSYQSKNAVIARRLEPHSSLVRKGHYSLPFMAASFSPGTFSFAMIVPNKELETTILPECFPLKRSRSLLGSSITPNSSKSKQACPVELQRSASLSTHAHAERNMTKEIQQYSKKSKSLFKALLSMHKQKKEGKPPRYMHSN